MEKRILLIGNNRGATGVQTDFINYIDFFKSKEGGLWEDSEIISKMNPSKKYLLGIIDKLHMLNLNFVIVIFSGHGGYKRGTIIEINEEETIRESELKNISKRQLNIFDCCRSMPEPLSDKGFSYIEQAIDVNIKDIYEGKIMQAIPQQIDLYACSIGESAYGNNRGGYYSRNLINVAMEVKKDYLYVGDAHEKAAMLTTLEKNIQHPDATLPRCLTSQQLIISLNPKKFLLS